MIELLIGILIGAVLAVYGIRRYIDRPGRRGNIVRFLLGKRNDPTPPPS